MYGSARKEGRSIYKCIETISTKYQKHLGRQNHLWKLLETCFLHLTQMGLLNDVLKTKDLIAKLAPPAKPGTIPGPALQLQHEPQWYKVTFRIAFAAKLAPPAKLRTISGPALQLQHEPQWYKVTCPLRNFFLV